MRRASGFAFVAALIVAACGGEPVDVPPPSPPQVTSAPTPDAASPEPPATVSPVPGVDLPPGLPATYGRDIEAAELPPEALVPPGAEVTGLWFAHTTVGDAVVVVWANPGGVALELDGGLAAWRRFDDEPPWQAVFGRSVAADDGVLGMNATIADVTGDGSDDGLVLESTGGTGACGRYLVLDLLAAGLVWTRELCDAQVNPSSAPVGLVVRRALYEQGDAHCCPSAFRTTVLTYSGDGRWTKASQDDAPA